MAAPLYNRVPRIGIIIGAVVWAIVIGAVAYYVFQVVMPGMKISAGVDVPLLITISMGEILGKWGYYIFLLLVWMQLWNCQFGIVDGFVRGSAEALALLSERLRKVPFRNLYLAILGVYTVIALAIVTVKQPYIMWLLSNWFGPIGFAVYVPVLLYINNKYLPKEIRPHPVWTAILIAATVMWIVLALVALPAMLKL